MISRRKARFYKGEWADIVKLIFAAKVGNGEYIKSFEEAFARYIGTRFAITTCSGRNAMDLLLDSLKLVPQDEVILPANTLEDFIPLIMGKELVPILVDIERESFNINPDLIEAKITNKTKVIIVTHRFGLCADMQKIMSIAQKYNLRVIEDCAHALGAIYIGKRVGSFGDAAFFVFGSTKPINSFGGGVIVINSPQVASDLRDKIKDYAVDSKKLLIKILLSCIEELIIRSPIYLLLNKLFMFQPTTDILVRSSLGLHQHLRPEYSRFTNLQALLGLRQLINLNERNRTRGIIAQKIIKGLSSQVKVQTSEFAGGRIFHFLIVRFLDNRDEIETLRRRLVLRGVDAGIKEEFIDYGARFLGKESEYPAMKEVFNRSIQLPLYDDLTERQIEAIIRTVNYVCS